MQKQVRRFAKVKNKRALNGIGAEDVPQIK